MIWMLRLFWLSLSVQNLCHFWSWHHDRKGLFSVRSVYRMLAQTKMRRKGWLDGTSSSENEKRGWSSVWKLKIPSKLKVFVWRLAQNSLPSKEEHVNDQYLFTLWWRRLLVPLIEHMSSTTEPNGKHWLFSLSDSSSHCDFTLMVVTLWASWIARRKAIHEEIFLNPFVTHGFNY